MRGVFHGARGAQACKRRSLLEPASIQQFRNHTIFPWHHAITWITANRQVRSVYDTPGILKKKTRSGGATLVRRFKASGSSSTGRWESAAWPPCKPDEPVRHRYPLAFVMAAFRDDSSQASESPACVAARRGQSDRGGLQQTQRHGLTRCSRALIELLAYEEPA